MLAHSRTRASAAGWILLGAATSALVLLSGVVPKATMAGWFAGLTALLICRLRQGPCPEVRKVAAVGLGVAAVYVGAMFVGSRLAERQAWDWATAQGLEPQAVMAGPVAANPFRRDVILVLPGAYRFVELGWFPSLRFEPAEPDLPRLPEGDKVVQAALAAEEVSGFRRWARYPSARIDPLPDGGFRVRFYDVRYSRRDPEGLGYAEVELDPTLRPRPRATGG